MVYFSPSADDATTTRNDVVWYLVVAWIMPSGVHGGITRALHLQIGTRLFYRGFALTNYYY